MIYRHCIPLLLLFLAAEVSGQEFLIVNSNRELFRVDIGDCSSQFVSRVQLSGGVSLSDITYTADGRLWGVTTDGRLFVITENTGEAALAYTFPNNNGPFFTSLVADGAGRIYSAGGNGDLYVYDINSMTHSYLGNIGYGSAGDLTFYEGQLVMASTSNQMIAIDLDNPANSSVLLNFSAGGQIFGIVTFVEDCDNTVTYVSNDSGNGTIFQINFESGQLGQACDLRMRIYGAASLLEFLAANPIEIESANTTPTTCANPQGIIEVAATGGNGPLSYSLDNFSFQPAGTFTGLLPGDYTVYIQDGQGCTARQMVTVEAAGDAPVLAVLGIREDSCGLGVGAIEVEPGGGLPPYQFSLGGGTPGNSPAFSGLAGGTYEVSVIDSRGCSSALTIMVPGEPGPQIEQAGLKPCGPGQSSLSVEAGGGLGMLSYSLDGGPWQSSPHFTGLDAGSFLIVVVDEAGCSDSRTVDMPAAEALAFTSVDADACGPGNSRLSVAASGGAGTLSFSLNNGPPQDSGIFDNLNPGDFTVLAADENGCTSTAPVSIPESAPPRILRLEVTPSRCGAPNGALQIETGGGTAPFIYSLNGREQASPGFDGLAPGAFLLSVRDAEGCAATDSVTVGLLCPVFIPNAFSPNDDGRNDRFEIYSGAEVQILAFRVFNRWGGLVYERTAFGSSERARFWDGRFRESPAPTGIYAYYIELINAAGEQEFYEGEVLLVR